jgi:hypothetical protein
MRILTDDVAMGTSVSKCRNRAAEDRPRALGFILAKPAVCLAHE